MFQYSSRTVNGNRKINGVPWAPKGPLPWDPLGSQGFPSHGRSPPMGSLGLQRNPLGGTSVHDGMFADCRMRKSKCNHKF